MRVDHYSPSAVRRAAFYWHWLRHGYRYANLITHHAFGIILRLTILFYFLFGIAFLGLRYHVLPQIDRYKETVERMFSDTVGRQVTISNIYASWRGIHPYLFLGGVTIYDKNGRQALALPGVSATFSWTSVFSGIRLRALEVSRPDLVIERDASGKIFVAGILMDTEKEGEGKGLEWVLSQDQIVIRDGSVRWHDRKRKAPELVLNEINFRMQNKWFRHQFALTAAPPAGSAAPIDVRADFRHPFYATRVADVRKWTGDLYLDLRDADLAAWKAYLDYPVEIARGRGAVRSWLSFDRAKVADFTTDLTLANVSTRLARDLEPLNLAHVNGRISVKEIFDSARDGEPEALGAEGHKVELTDFTMRTEEGLVLPPTTVSETHIPARSGHAERTAVNIKALDLYTLADFVERLPLPRTQRQLLNDFAPRGQLQDFQAEWTGAYPEIASYKVKGNFVNLALKAQPPRAARPRTALAPAQAAVPAIPGFENLTGSVDAGSRGGSFALVSDKVRLDLPSYFKEPVIALDRLRMQAKWSIRDSEQVAFDVSRMEVVQDGLTASFSGRHVLPLTSDPRSKPLGTLDLNGVVGVMDVKRIGPLLPATTPEPLRNWLANGIESGTLKDVRIRIKGDLAHFPFNKELNGRHSGEFTVSGRMENARLNYTPGTFGRDGKSPMWPTLEQLNGTIAFDRKRLDIRGDTARSHEIALSKVKASIADLFSPDILLTVEGEGRGPLQEMVRFTADSPVGEWIGRFTDDTHSSGNALLSLKLELPLNRIAESKVEGAVHFNGNEVALFEGLPSLAGTQGKLSFSHRGFLLEGVKGNFLGGPVIVAGGTQRDGSTVIKATGTMTGSGLRRAYASPAVQRLAERLSGSTRYNVSVAVRKKRPEVVVESNLQGLSVDFPAPLRKGPNEIMPFRFELAGQGSDEAGVSRDEIKVSLGSSIAARYQREKSEDGSWRVARGGIGINVPAPIPDSGLIANVNMNSLNLDAWTAILSGVEGNDKPKSSEAPRSAFAQYVEPEVLAARATELIVGGKKLDNVVVGASHQKSSWQANIDSEQASGYVTWDEGNGQTLGKVTARLASLTVPKSAVSDVSDLLEGKTSTSQIPALDITAESFELFGKKLGRLELQASNVPGSASREWRINRLSLSNPDAELKATGKWIPGGGDMASNLNYTLDIGNAGHLLDRLGFANVMRNGKGKMSGNLNWKGMPFAFDIPSLSGQIKLEVSSGQIMSVDLGGAKLLGVLSLQGLPRLREVVAEGLAFESIASTATITQGVAKTDNFKLRSVNMTVAIDGSVDIVKETQNLHAVIIPDYNLGAASAVYALAVNPAIGVGTFLAQLFLREPIARALTMEYRVTGPWKAPVYTRLDKKGEAKAPVREDDMAG